MRFVRGLGWLLIALAFVAAGMEALYALERGALEWMPFGLLWYRLSPETLGLAQAAIQRHVWAALWDPAIIWLLRLPASAVFLGGGLALWATGGGGRARKRRFRRKGA